MLTYDDAIALARRLETAASKGWPKGYDVEKVTAAAAQAIEALGALCDTPEKSLAAMQAIYRDIPPAREGQEPPDGGTVAAQGAQPQVGIYAGPAAPEPPPGGTEAPAKGVEGVPDWRAMPWAKDA